MYVCMYVCIIWGGIKEEGGIKWSGNKEGFLLGFSLFCCCCCCLFFIYLFIYLIIYLFIFQIPPPRKKQRPVPSWEMMIDARTPSFSCCSCKGGGGHLINYPLFVKNISYTYIYIYIYIYI